nr:MAG TPA: hypothetical protein [Caudoviricetes sp.]
MWETFLFFRFPLTTNTIRLLVCVSTVNLAFTIPPQLRKTAGKCPSFSRESREIIKILIFPA